MISTKIHGVMDYLVGIILIASPWIFGFARMGAETWLPVIIGAGSILYGLFTDYELGVVKVIRMPAHLAIDILAGAVLAVSPWLFTFAEFVWVPHLAVGAIMIAAGTMTQRTPSETKATL